MSNNLSKLDNSNLKNLDNIRNINRRNFLKYGLILGSGFLAGCAGFDLGKLDSVMKIGSAVAKSVENITPEQEYYIGRTIAATLLAKYPSYENKKANNYINLVGQTLAKVSDRPETFGGYHFLIQDSQDINAFAAPGGLIFVTRGLIKCCKSEDALASVLAHEIGHVQYKHGLKAIKASRVTNIFTTAGSELAKHSSGGIAAAFNTFEDSIKDITNTLVNNGYSRSLEEDADKASVNILTRLGYNPNGLIEMLEIMAKTLKPGGLDFAKTHPSPKDRIEHIEKLIGKYSSVSLVQERQDRFISALEKI